MEDQIDPVDDALARARAALADLAAARLWGRGDGQSRELVADLAAVRAVTESVYLAAVRTWMRVRARSRVRLPGRGR